MTNSKITDKTTYLEVNFPEYEPISKAPAHSELEAKAKELGLSYEIFIKQERNKRYSAIDKNDNVVLIQNPAVWETTYFPGGFGAACIKLKPSPLSTNRFKPNLKTTF